MPDASSPPIAVADATPWVWEGAGPETISYEIRFYPTAQGVTDLDQTGGTRTVTVTTPDSIRYADRDITTEHTSTMEDAPPTLITAGKWTLLGLGLGESRVTFSAAQGAEPAGGTHYRILVKW